LGPSDVTVANSPDEVSQWADGERLVLLQVDSPFRVRQERGSVASNDPRAAGDELDEIMTCVGRTIESGMANGADGVLYRLFGARAGHTTPMEYGGFYLERDREILESVADASLNILLLVGDGDLYLDFVSDLPAHVMAWDAAASGFSSNYLRNLRDGAQASCDPESEIFLDHSGIRIADRLERS
jgi:hypothetical protein